VSDQAHDDNPKPFVRFDFGADLTDGGEEPDFKAMAEAFQEFARKAMSEGPKNPKATDDDAS
jgi:hypothetical protein